MNRTSETPATPPPATAVDEGATDKEKKRSRRRSARRSKLNSPLPSSASVSGSHGESFQSAGYVNKTRTSSIDFSSTRQPISDEHSPGEDGWTTMSNVAFDSMPTMWINDQVEHLLPSEFDVTAKSCLEPIAGGVSLRKYTKEELHNPHHEGHAPTKVFASYWSTEACNKALEKGDAFKALFRVNAHNRLEAYCKIEGVPTDILISGIPAQNRAVEGDIVVIKVDPPSLWTKMKGSNGPSGSSAECCGVSGQENLTENGHCKGKNKVDADSGCTNPENSSFLQKKLQSGECSSDKRATHQELKGSVDGTLVNGHHLDSSDSSHLSSFSQNNDALNGVERLCAMLRAYPLKRPTGRVVAIVEVSLHRDTVIGFLNVKQWLCFKQGCKKEARNKKTAVLFSDDEYLQFTPTDPRFPKMVVSVRDLPDCIKKRLEDGDASVETELVAACMDIWDENSLSPQARVCHVFGLGSEMEPWISAILYENGIHDSDFSPELLSCLPNDSWVVPPEEFQTRKDLRNMCVFTIDPSTATDLDDALSFEKLPNGTTRVGVHIADVSYFVSPDTTLDTEAQIRSTSVYMLGRKLSMLPPLLSENLGSLNPGVDRLAFSIFWDFGSGGDVLDRWIRRTVIQSCCKLSYEHAQDILDGSADEEAHQNSKNGFPELHGRFRWSDVIRSVKGLNEISKLLREKRFKDGALRLESSKIAFLCDEDRIPYDSELCERKQSNFLVEEFMLLANRTAAEVISRAFPESALLRRHPEPNMRKLRELEAFCSKHGLQLDASTSGHFQRSLEVIQERLSGDSVLFDILISYATKPMQLATYFCSGEMKDNRNDWGHYALAVPLYTHFTSPLRRYPDIIVHRTVAAALEAEEMLTKNRKISKSRSKDGVIRCLTSLHFDKNAVESIGVREALSAAAIKHGIPCTELLADVAAYCNMKKLASRHVKDACDKLYMWILLKKKKILLTEARVLGLGPRFMSLYIPKFAIERRIYYDEVGGLMTEWLETTSTLVLHLSTRKRSSNRNSTVCYRPFNEVACVVRPQLQSAEECETACKHKVEQDSSKSEIEPLVFPLTVHLLSTIPVALHAVGGDDGPLDVGVRLYMSSYLR